jgi:hypothetical protein
MAPNAAFKSFDPDSDSDPDPDLPQPGYRDRLLVPEYCSDRIARQDAAATCA